MKGQSHPAKRLLIGYLCMGIGILVLVVKLAGGTSNDSNPIPFYIGGSGEATSHVMSNIVTVYFQMDLMNADNKKKMIHSIEPILHDEAETALLDKTRPIFVVERTLDKKVIEIAGEIHIDKTKLSGDDIAEHMPFVYVYKVTYDDDQVELVPVTYGQHGDQLRGLR